MRTRLTAAAIAAAAFLTLTACNSDDSDDDTNGKTAPTTAPSKSAQPSTSSAFLRPTPAQEVTLLASLTSIDPALTANTERAVRRSVNVCDDILKGKDHATVVKNAAYRYDGGTAHVDTAKAEKIVTAIKGAYCKA
jgi:pectin methylesterase-like acyl-CoA thioesterase